MNVSGSGSGFAATATDLRGISPHFSLISSFALMVF
jgi:hypothetical protein